MNRIITGIKFNRNLLSLTHIFTIFEHMCIYTWYYDYNPLLKAVQLMVSEVLILHENIELFPSGDSYDISLGNNYIKNLTPLVLVRKPIRNQLGWVDVAKEDWSWGTKPYLFFRGAFEIFDIANFFERKNRICCT